MDQEKSTFEDWKKRVDAALVALCGMGADDLPDVDYWRMWSDRVKPATAARRVLRAARLS